MVTPVDALAFQGGLPEWWIDTIHITHSESTDALGREWTIGQHPAGEKGWSSSAAPRTVRTDRPNSHGSYRSANYRKGRTISLAGTVWCPTIALREQTELELAALCSDPGRLYTYRRRTTSYDQFADVELDDEPLIDTMSLWRVDWSYQLYAPDPRKHDYQVQAPIAGPPIGGASGVDFSSPGLDFTSPGLDFGTPGLPQPVSVGNYGTAPAYPVIQVFGPATNGVVRCTTSGFEFIYAAPLDDGEILTINCDAFPRDGYPPRRAISNVHGDVRNFLSITGWPTVDPGGLETFTLLTEAAPTTQLRVLLRSAWW